MPYALLTDNVESNQPDIYYLSDAKRQALKTVKSGKAEVAEVVLKDTDKVYWRVERDKSSVRQGTPYDMKTSGRVVPALAGNQNALKGKHGSQVIRLPVELVDSLYDCLALEGELLTQENPGRIRGYVLSILSTYVRRRIENNQAIIL